VPARMIRALVLILVAGFITPTGASAEMELPDSSGAPLRFANVKIEPDNPTAGSVATVRFEIEDQFGNAVTGLRPSGLLRAPSTAQDEAPPSPTLTTIGRELSEPGHYEVAVALNQAGRWWIEVRVDNEVGQIARYDHFTMVDAVEEPVPATTSEPIFLRGDEWDEFYRVDPNTGSVSALDGVNVFQVGDRWWIANVRMQERGSISSQYGGTWRLNVELRDAISGSALTTINLGDVRANVFSGSLQDPAIATAVTIAPDGSAVYLYWARQLGDGWIANLIEADPLTGEIRNERMLTGAISSNGFWAELYLRDDGHLLVAEQVVELASVSGYRLSLIERGTLDIVTQYRRTDAREDPLTHCMLAYPGPIGAVADEAGTRFSVCSPPENSSKRSLLIWNPLTGEAEHTIDLQEVIEADSTYTDGVASPDQSTFYAINTQTLRIAEIDLRSGEITRERNMLPDEENDPSTLDRLFDWVFGTSMEPVEASGTVEPGVAITPDGQTLFVIASPESREPGVMVIDIENLELINSLKTGENVEGVASTVDGRLVVVQRNNGSAGDAVTVLDRDGNTYVAFTLPGKSDILGARR
jgi:hypothetical protein